jgi:hypothetical protein
MNIEELKDELKRKCPREWVLIEQLVELSHELGVKEGHMVKLPRFDENDEVIHYWGGTLSAKEDKHD